MLTSALESLVLLSLALALPSALAQAKEGTNDDGARRVQRRTVVTNDTSLGYNKIQLIKGLLDTTAQLSWEIGTHAQALTEYDYPTLSPFFGAYTPPPTNPFGLSVVTIAASVLSNKPPGTLPLMADTSAGDPGSLGPSVLLAALTVGSGGYGGFSRADYLLAAQQQAQYLLQVAPRTSDGAISHRGDQVQLWSDFVYMVPPFLAYYGVLTKNTTIIQAAYDQCRLYRQYLRQPSGLWIHIALGTNADPGLWATGNGWAAAGMMRVLVTILNSKYASQYVSQTNNLTAWIIEIVTAAFAQQQPSSYLFPNYFSASPVPFLDASSTALLTSVSYRLAQFNLSLATLPAAERSRLSLYTHVSSSTGLLTPVVNPNSYPDQGTSSPEGEAFLLLMESAWRDWIGGGGIAGDIVVGSDGALSPVPQGPGTGTAVRLGGAGPIAAAVLGVAVAVIGGWL